MLNKSAVFFLVFMGNILEVSIFFLMLHVWDVVVGRVGCAFLGAVCIVL